MKWRIRLLIWRAMWTMWLYGLDVPSRGIWIWVGRIGIAFRRIPRFSTKLMVKRGERRGVRVSQFGPLVVTWQEAA